LEHKVAKKKQKAFLDSNSWEQFRQEFTNADDRSCALLGAAYLDHCLELLLLRALVKCEATDNLLGETNPLGTFSAKIKMAFSLNLIPLVIFQDLEVIRKIRNAFAHQLNGLFFSCDPIESLARRLKFPEDYLGDGQWTVESALNDDPRQMFIFSCSVISSLFESYYLERAENVQKTLMSLEPTFGNN